jgi:hypothetical protein
MLNLELNIAAPDEFYAALIEAHRDLSASESAALNARLILLLANHIGDAAVLSEALNRARPITREDAPCPASPAPMI